MTAREIARTYVAQAWTDATPVSAADVASDVWEPIVKQLAAALRFSPYIEQSKTQAAMDAAAKALGVSVIDLRDLR